MRTEEWFEIASNNVEFIMQTVFFVIPMYSMHSPFCFLLKEWRSITVVRIQDSQSIDFLLRCVPFSPQKAVASRREAPSTASLSPSLCSR